MRTSDDLLCSLEERRASTHRPSNPVQRLAFNVWRLAFGVRRSAFGVGRDALLRDPASHVQ